MLGHMGGLINPHPGRGQYRAGFSKTGGSPRPRKRAPCQKNDALGAQRFINLEIPVLVRSLKSSNVELSQYLDGRLFECCLSAAANPENRLDLITGCWLCVDAELVIGQQHKNKVLLIPIKQNLDHFKLIIFIQIFRGISHPVTTRIESIPRSPVSLARYICSSYFKKIFKGTFS